MLDELFSALDPYLKVIPLRAIGDLLIRNEFNAIWCGATFLYFVGCFCVLRWRAWPISRALSRVSKPLKGADKEAFARQFEGYAKTVTTHKCLAHAWREFDDSLVKPREGDALRIRNTHEPGMYFNEATVVQPAVHARFFDTVPNQLVGLGILGTFLGLAAGVGLASGKLDSGDPQEIQQALSQLLNGASLAFMTSIFGLGLSLVFLWTERWMIGSVHRRLNTWVERLETCVELVTPEQISLEQLEHAKRQTIQLERFNTDLVFALESALDQKVAQRLVPELEKVVQAIHDLRVDRQDSNQALIQRLVEEFSQTLTQSAGREMDQVASTLQRLGDRLEALGGTLEASQQQARGIMDEAARNLRDSMTTGSSAVVSGLEGAVQAMARQLEAAAQQMATEFSQTVAQSAGREMDQVATTLKLLGDRLETVGGTFEGSQQQARGMMDEAARNLRDSLASGSGAAAAGMERAAHAMTQQLEAAVRQMAEQMSGAGSGMHRSAEAAAQQIAGALRGFAEGVSRLERVSAAQAELAPRLEQLATGLRDAGTTVVEAHRGFANSLEPTRAVVRGLEAAGGRLAEALSSTNRVVEQVAATGGSMHEQQQRMAAAWQDYARRFQDIDQVLQRAFTRLTEGVENYTEQIRKFHSDVDAHMGKAIHNLGSATKELSESVEDLGPKLTAARR